MSADANMFEPEDDYQAEFTISEPVFFKDRGTHAPGWYVKHKNPRKTLVTQKGAAVAPGFFVSEVAPERRWAITETGEVLDELAFMQKHELWWRENFSLKGQPSPEVALRPLPTVAKFVAVRVSKAQPGKVEAITRTPKEQAAFNPQVQFDANGENPRAPLIEQTDGSFEVKGGAEVLQAVEAAREKIVAEADDSEDAEIEAAVAEEMVTSRCGKQIAKRLHGSHVRHHCEECRRIRAEEALNAKK